MFVKLLVALFTLLYSLNTAQAADQEGTRHLRKNSQGAVLCEVKLFEAELLVAGKQIDGPLSRDQAYICNIGSLSYKFKNLPADVLGRVNPDDKKKDKIRISKARIDKKNALIDIASDSTIIVGDENSSEGLSSAAGDKKKKRKKAEKNTNDNEGRQLTATSFGARSVLILRVTYRGIAPTMTAAQLAGRNFGNTGTSNDQTVNLITQYKACSFNKLNFNPASGNYPNLPIVNGVAEINIDEDLSSTDIFTLENAVITKAQTLMGVTNLKDVFQHTMIVVPNAGFQMYGNSWIAYGYVNWWKTVYYEEWGSRISAVMHELGHNMGMLHSNEAGTAYGDTTGYMGFSQALVGSPAKCFNAEKNFFLGWFDDRKITLDTLQLPWSGTLASFVDYDATAPDQYVVVAVTAPAKRIFFQLNSQKEFNHQTGEYGNKIVVVGDDGSTTYESETKGTLMLPGSTVTYPLFNGVSNLVVTLCKGITFGALDYATVSVHLDDGIQTNACPTPTSAPTLSPTTKAPTVRPTPAPTSAKLTKAPTVPPTSPPSTKAPTKAPTRAPTRAPTVPPAPTPTSPPPNCVDGLNKFTYKGKLRDCLWVSKQTSKNKIAACKVVSSSCPLTCGLCTK